MLDNFAQTHQAVADMAVAVTEAVVLQIVMRYDPYPC